MKKILLTAVLTLIGIHTTTAQVGIGTETPDASAALEIKSTTQGFLPPRMTQAERNLIGTPVQGLMIYCNDCGANGEAQLYNGIAWTTMTGGVTTAAPFVCGDNVTFIYNGSDVTYGTVSGAGSTCWLDRNLGASQVATSSTDAAAYGDLYQWGRAADGHQLRTSATTSTLSTTDTAGHGDYITTTLSPYDWRSPQNDNLWQGVDGVNNPCPSGYRVPTDAELDAERLTWNSNDSAGAYASALKLPMPGSRRGSDGSLFNVGFVGIYWSSTVSSTDSRYLFINNSSANMNSYDRVYARSVRCIKE